MHSRIRRLLTVLLMVSAPQIMAATEIIQLKYRMADELLPMAQSVIGEERRIHAYGNQLIVNAPEAQLRELRNLLEQLDTPPKRLLITIDSSETKTGAQHGYSVDASAEVGNVNIQSGHSRSQGENRIRILNRTTGSDGSAQQQIQATEGYPALIQNGLSIPLHSTHIGPYGQIRRETEYRDVTRGIYAIVRVSGEIVHITLTSDNGQLDPSQPGIVDIQRMKTQVSGHLGEWIELGGGRESRQSDRQGILRQHSTSSSEELSMRLKVELLE